MSRTRLLGPELIRALERVDEVLESHDNNKGNEWPSQPWQKHIGKAIAHLANALVNQEDGSEIEAAHGACRAIMGLQKILEDETVERKLCKLHARPPGTQVYSSASVMFKDPMMQYCSRHGLILCEMCGYLPMGTP